MGVIVFSSSLVKTMSHACDNHEAWYMAGFKLANRRADVLIQNIDPSLTPMGHFVP